MANLSDLQCAFCDHPLERVRYFSRQLLSADDMTVEQEYFRQKLRRHNRYLHGFGVACGLTVEAAPDAEHPWQVRICPGYAVAPQGDEILVPAATLYDLATGAARDEPCAPCPCPPVPNLEREARQIVFLGVKYSECSTRPVRLHPSGCGCDDCACDYSRVRDDFCLATLFEMPDCYVKQGRIDADLLKRLAAFKQSAGGAIADYANVWNPAANGAGLFGAAASTAVSQQRPPALPVPECLCCADPWVILATIRLPASLATPITANDMHFLHRRVLYSESALAWLALAT